MKDAFKKLKTSKQRRILKAALKEFAKNGLYQANIADISKRAGISNGSVYVYFKNKNALYISVADYCIEQMIQRLYQQYTTIDGPYFEVLEHLLYGTVEFARKNKDAISLYLEIGCIYHNKFAKHISEKLESSAIPFHVKLIDAAKRKGEINASIKTDLAAYVVDNNLTFLAYSIHSEHYNRRFKSYFGADGAILDTETKIQFIMEMLRQYFQ